jgi:hypothetical protein
LRLVLHSNRKAQSTLSTKQKPQTIKHKAMLQRDTHHAIIVVFLILLSPLCAQSQTGPARKIIGGSISGKVTIKGKGAPGIIVVLRSRDYYRNHELARSKDTTDQDGNYRITNVPTGPYEVLPIAPAFVISGATGPFDAGAKSLIIGEGETVKDVDFSLTRGGVITGTVTDTEGNRLIEENVIAVPTEMNGQSGQMYRGFFRPGQTDDRGVYRVFGLPPGKYRVQVGMSGSGSGMGGRASSSFKTTFYPDATDVLKATQIEVTEGSEATNVDITVTPNGPVDKFAVSGRIEDGDTGRPIANLTVGLQKVSDDGGYSNSGGWTTNNSGEFKVGNLAPGNYSIFVEPPPNSEIRVAPVPFQITDQDVTGLVVKTSHGASLSGVVVLEGTDDKSVLAKLNQLRLETFVRRETRGNNFARSSTLNADGGFRVGGLDAGMASFALTAINQNSLTGFTIARIERDGIPSAGEVEVKNGEQITGIRLVLNYGNGTIRGIVKGQNGELPVGQNIGLSIMKDGEVQTNRVTVYSSSPQVDSRGHFLAEGLTAGIYEVTASLFLLDARRLVSAKQKVNVADGIVTDITLTLDLKPKPGNP